MIRVVWICCCRPGWQRNTLPSFLALPLVIASSSYLQIGLSFYVTLEANKRNVPLKLMNAFMVFFEAHMPHLKFSPQTQINQTRSIHSGRSNYTSIMHYFSPHRIHAQTFFPVLQNSLAHSGDLVYSPRLWATESWFLLKMHWAAQHDKPIIEPEEEKSLNYQLATLEGEGNVHNSFNHISFYDSIINILKC